MIMKNKMPNFVCTALLPSLAVLLLGVQSAQAGASVYVGSPSAGPSVSMDKIDHSGWDRILKKYDNTDGMVDYQGLKASSVDIQGLNSYLQQLSTAHSQVQATKEGTLAFWINAYNAVTVHGILREYPTTSIRNHTAKVLRYNIWKDLKLYVGGQPYSLEQIEHEILRKMGEPRIHFAIVCASIGCPRLLNEAYVANRLNDQLEVNSRDFFSRSRNFRYDQSSNVFHMSAILKWFPEDFGANQAAQLRTIAGWLPNDAAKNAALSNSVSVRSLEYDWALNRQ